MLKLKPGEPHDRHQGATNLEAAKWSKPSKSGRTTRAERVRDVAAPDRRWTRAKRHGSSRNQSGGSSQEQRDHREWTPRSEVDGGAIFDNPKRGVHLPIPFLDGRPSGQPERNWTRRYEQRELECVFEGDAKVMRVRPLVDPTPGRSRTGSPSQSRVAIARRQRKDKEGE